MGLKSVCVHRHTSTFSSDLDERVFLCLQQDVKREALGMKRMNVVR